MGRNVTTDRRRLGGCCCAYRDDGALSIFRNKNIQMGVRGRAIIVTAPSGSGKTTIVRHLLLVFEELAFSISATTRAQREEEVDGEDYHFLSPEEFQKRIDENGFIEWEEVYPGKRYGSLKSEVARLSARGKVVVFDVDVKGASALKDHFGDGALALFIKPPSIEALRGRLEKRKSESANSIRQRVERAQEELEFASRFDRVILNEHLRTALRDTESSVRKWLAID